MTSSSAEHVVIDSLPIDTLPSDLDPTLLKRLECTNCTNIKSIDFAPYTNLKVLVLTGCSGLESLVDIEKLPQLEELVVNGCSSLRTLPALPPSLRVLEADSAGELQSINLSGLLSLEKLDISDTVIESLDALPSSLRELKAKTCEFLTALPASIGNVHVLETLDLEGCYALTSLPSDIGNLTALKVLNLGSCEKLEELPPSLGNCKALEVLDVQDCANLVSLPTEILQLKESLKKVHYLDCPKLVLTPEQRQLLAPVLEV